jgi:hypothetical protein
LVTAKILNRTTEVYFVHFLNISLRWSTWLDQTLPSVTPVICMTLVDVQRFLPLRNQLRSRVEWRC